MKSKLRILLVVLASLSAACATAESTGQTTDDPSANVAAGGDSLARAETVRLGYFPNVTHAPAIVGVVEGLFTDDLGGTSLETATFNAGTEAVEAIFSGAIDISFMGPNPAINAFAQSDGAAVRIVSGTTSGGASLVVRPDLTSVEDLAGTSLSSPSLGNTQDVALRAWLADQGYETTLEGGGDVSILPQRNSQILQTFISGEIDGAWVPEPWATRLLLEGEGSELVDERDLWPDGRFVTTHLVVSTEFLEEYPGTVKDILEGLLASVELIESDPDTARAAVNTDIEAITGARIPSEVLEVSWEKLTFTLDPIASSLRGSAESATAVGLLDPVDLTGIYDLNLVNDVLTTAGLETVSE